MIYTISKNHKGKLTVTEHTEEQIQEDFKELKDLSIVETREQAIGYGLGIDGEGFIEIEADNDADLISKIKKALE